MPSKPTRMGYLLIDHRNSPGDAAVGAGVTFEADTATCAHCQRIVVLNPDRTRARGYCRRCDRYVCDACAACDDCTPVEARLEAVYNQMLQQRAL